MIFITGTDTGCGKTTVGRAIAAALASRGLKVAPFKACETGCEVMNSGHAMSEHRRAADAQALARAARNVLPEDVVCPVRFLLPASPERAAEAEGTTISIDVIKKAWLRARYNADFGIAEGAGGLLVPIRPDMMMIDLPSLLDLPVLVVARDALGTVNHTLLTLEAIRARGITQVGVIFSATSEGAESLENAKAIEQYGKVEILGRLPYLPEATDDVLASAAEDSFELDRLLRIVKDSQSW